MEVEVEVEEVSVVKLLFSAAGSPSPGCQVWSYSKSSSQESIAIISTCSCSLNMLTCSCSRKMLIWCIIFLTFFWQIAVLSLAKQGLPMRDLVARKGWLIKYKDHLVGQQGRLIKYSILFSSAADDAWLLQQQLEFIKGDKTWWLFGIGWDQIFHFLLLLLDDWSSNNQGW